MALIDKETIRAEIERQRQFIGESFTEGDNTFYDGQDDAYCYILAFLDSAPEQPVEGLEKEIDKYFDGWLNDAEYGQAVMDESRGFLCAGVDDCKDIARHFAEWQREQDQQLIELAEDHAMLAGMNKMKQEMMEKIESRISEILGDAQPNPVLRMELQGVIDKIKNCI